MKLFSKHFLAVGAALGVIAATPNTAVAGGSLTIDTPGLVISVHDDRYYRHRKAKRKHYRYHRHNDRYSRYYRDDRYRYNRNRHYRDRYDYYGNRYYTPRNCPSQRSFRYYRY